MRAKSRIRGIGGLSVALAPIVHRYGPTRFWLVSWVSFGLACASPSSSPPRSSPRPLPASTTRDYSRIESEVLAALNRARTNPVSMATSIERLIPYFDGRVLRRPTWPVPVQTNEGVSAVREAVSALRSQRALGALSLSSVLTRAARDHVADQGRTGATGHTGSDNSTTTTRVARYGAWQTSLSENIDYSPMVSGSDVVENLIVDDGVADRGHRRNIYDATAKVVGIACGPHPRFTATCVIVQAGAFTAK
jgi:uncharacterized protein YkwD